MTDRSAERRVETTLTRVGRCSEEQYGFINAPIYRGSTTLYRTFDDAMNARAPFMYGTHGNPTVAHLQSAWTALTGGAGTVILSSGMAAVSFVLLAVAKSGDNVLVMDTAYMPTRRFCDEFLRDMGITTTYYDPLITAEELRSLLTKMPKTTALIMESPGSQTFEVQDVPTLTTVAREFGVTSVLDNTWATPLFFDAHGKGCDISVEAGTKYLGGHSDLLLGMVSANAAWYPKIKHTLSLWQCTPGNEDCFLALRGLRTLYIRLKEAEKRALDLAQFLQNREEVLRVLHPAFPECPGHEIWKRDFTGSSGLFSIILRPQYTLKDVERMLDGLQLFGMGFSWGGFESLIMYYDCTANRTATTFAPGGLLIRIQVGLENLEDLKRDLVDGFKRLRGEHQH
ncbi:cystathionine beta-lyase putative (CD) [Leptomonas pyrrhocoris]|uniref:Cystathionine beta-lyase putative (CD) n=1 Tax=Leptomonas pyrrhocoris TaxID=157538 RepID=A0A0M9G2Y6_LEPPY|nr:cystathionine beta-lyase putative (CD) [Leptomonas pyrrhocoris]KPA81157.1 cystathionine beta-lyase putative (CD) [Leptomonas pyrrhocoris]|eukprot:XP_015659596.1 cystathionine beta-lyase putative (CD) [Leptomonas pyrrhocoris]